MTETKFKTLWKTNHPLHFPVLNSDCSTRSFRYRSPYSFERWGKCISQWSYFRKKYESFPCQTKWREDSGGIFGENCGTL